MYVRHIYWSIVIFIISLIKVIIGEFMFVIQVLECPWCGRGPIRTASLVFKLCPFCNKVFRVDLDQANLVNGNFREFMLKKKILGRMSDEKLKKAYKKISQFALQRLPDDGKGKKKGLKDVGYFPDKTFREKAFVHSDGISE